MNLRRELGGRSREIRLPKVKFAAGKEWNNLPAQLQVKDLTLIFVYSLNVAFG